MSPKLQLLQYINGYLPTRKFLCTRGVVGSPLCLICFEIDNFQHFFYECEEVKAIWEHILLNIKNKLSLRDDFVSVRTVLFGYPAGPAVVNLIILIVKQYLVTNKLSQCQTKHVFKEGAIEAIVNHWRVERIIAIKNKSLDKFISKWRMIIGSDGELLLV